MGSVLNQRSLLPTFASTNEHLNMPLFSAIITGDIPDDIYARVKECITLHSGSVVWVPSGEKL